MSWVSAVENTACLRDKGVQQLSETVSILVAVNIVLGLLVFLVVPVLLCFRKQSCAYAKRNEGRAARMVLEKMARENSHDHLPGRKPHDIVKISRKHLKRRLEARSQTSTSRPQRSRGGGRSSGYSNRVRKVRDHLERVGYGTVATIVDPDGTGTIQVATLARVFSQLGLPASRTLLGRLPGVRRNGSVRTVQFMNWVFAGGASGARVIPPLPPRVKGARNGNPRVSPRRSRSL